MNILHYRPDDPFSQRALIALAYSGVECELKQAEASAEPLPVLETADERFENSLEIMDWLLDQMEKPLWVDWDLDQMEDSIMLLDLTDGPFWGYLEEAMETSSGSEQLELLQCAAGFLQQLEALLSETDYLLLRERPLLPDFAILPFVLLFARTAPAFWSELELPGLQRWMQALLEDPACRCLR